MSTLDDRTALRPVDNATFVLAQLRLLRARARLLLNEIDTVGASLKAGLIAPRRLSNGWTN
ncbi:MAG TPA: hypothetical protein VGI22_22965 [Xanthobacteraceae bacterium]|jgi:hypothetical protein